MITVQQSSLRKGTTRTFPDQTYKNPHEAMHRLVIVDLQWNSIITDVDPDGGRLSVETSILDDLDMSTYTGPVDEMRPLLQMAHYFLEASIGHGTVIKTHVLERIKNSQHTIGETPLLLAAIAPRLEGEERLKAAILLACGVTEEKDMKTYLPTRMRDLTVALELAGSGSCTFRDALELAR